MAEKTKRQEASRSNPWEFVAAGAEASFGVGVGISIILTVTISPEIPLFTVIVTAPLVVGVLGGAVGGYIYGVVRKHKEQDTMNAEVTILGASPRDIMTSLRIDPKSLSANKVKEKSSAPDVTKSPQIHSPSLSSQSSHDIERRHLKKRS